MEDHLAETLFISSPDEEAGILSVAAPETFNWPKAILSAFQKPMGARFFRCALQVNTPLQDRFKGFDSKHAKHSPAYKHDYGLALAKKCKKTGIDVVGICDHNSVDYLDAIRRQLNEENIFVFPGFEVASTEGLHLLCLFDLETPTQELDHVLTELGLPPKERWVTGVGHAPRQSPKSFPQIIEHIQRRRRGICIAAHMDRENGLLFECAKTTRAQYFTDNNLLAGQISGARKNLTPFNRKVLAGEFNHYLRSRPLALVNCLDVYNLKELGQPASSAWIKMSTPSIEGLWQACLDPESRLRLLTETERGKPQSELELENFKLVAISWEGGFLDGCGIRFNENLNCLIGGRGAGKSTVIESLRFVLDQKPIGASAQEAHDGLLKEVIQPGTKVSLLIYTQHPAPGYYRIERAFPGEPVVFDERGEQCPLRVFDLCSGVEIFGQHEIAEIANDLEKQLALLHRFRDEDAPKWEVQKQESLSLLAQNRIELLEIWGKWHALEEQLSRLPVLEERMRQFRDSGVEQKLQEQALLAREEQILLSARERLQRLKSALEQLRRQLDTNGAESIEHDHLPNRDLCEKIAAVEERLREKWLEMVSAGEQAWQRAQRDMLALAQEWEKRKRSRQEEYQRILRELQKEAGDGVAFVNLRKEIERLDPLRAHMLQLEQKRRELEKKRKRLLQKRQEANVELFKIDQAAAGHVSRLLAGKVQVTVAAEVEHAPLVEKFKSIKIKKAADIFECLHNSQAFRLHAFIGHVRAGKEALVENYGLTAKHIEALQKLDESALLELEELDLPHGISIELNVAPPGEKPRWRALGEVSTGQKATAILLMLLPESGTPLIIDQPEDDLDNRFIADQIIPKLREEKQKRQFLFATHNANLPVLGDAEQIIGLEAGGDGTTGKAHIHKNSVGSIDCQPVKELVEQILEGGQRAFEMRRVKYGF
ncbi:MAG: TrlF family AAA-like ATPase [bacterium]